MMINIFEDLQKIHLTESKELYQGIFWIIDDYNRDYCFTIPSTSDGDVLSYDGLNAKSGKTYNHEKLWATLPRSMTKGKPYNYYPRGRVQITRGVATVYYNPNLDCEEFRKFIKDEFNLTEINGISKIRWFPDYSDHYRSVK